MNEFILYSSFEGVCFLSNNLPVKITIFLLLSAHLFKLKYQLIFYWPAFLDQGQICILLF